jgi:signal transduction histidine kinase
MNTSPADSERESTDRKVSVPGVFSPELPIILGEIADGVSMQDASGRLIYANHAAARASGFETPEQMLAAPPAKILERFELFDELGAPLPFDILPGRQVLQGEPGTERVVCFRRRGSTEDRWSVVRALPVLDTDGRLAAVINIFKDVTHQKRTENSLRFLLDASQVLAETLDYQGRLAALASAVVPHLADWCAVDLVGDDGSLERLAVAHQDPEHMRWAEQIHERYPPNPDNPRGVYQVIRTGRSELFAEIDDATLTAAARDAEHLALLRQVGFRSAMVVPLAAHDRIFGALTMAFAESGRRYGPDELALAEDLVHRAALAIDNARLFREVQQARETLEEQATELEEIATELEQANAELLVRSSAAEAANRAKSNFLAIMSHELRTPLNAIAGYVDLLQMQLHGPVNEAQQEDLRRIQHNQQHLLGIINDVLNFARLETGHVELTIDDVPLAPALRAVLTLTEPRLASKRLTLQYRADNASLAVRADPEKLRQILLNLISNAIKFTPPDGRIHLQCDASRERVRIRVEDTGPGIPPEQLQLVFEPFVQLAPALTRENAGVGLGLSISRDLARAMNGELRADSVPGSGATFELILPRALDEER